MQKGLPILFSVCALFLFSCRQSGVKGHGQETAESRNIPSFSSIEIDAPLNADITIKPNFPISFQLTGYQNLISYIKSDVKAGVLHIYTINDVSFTTDKEVQAHIMAPSLSALSISGASDAVLHGPVTGSEFDIDVSGAGKVTIDSLSVQKFSSDVSGVAVIQVNAGNANNADYNISGDGTVRAFSLKSNNVSTDISGAGKVEVNAQNKLNAQINGAGQVRYKGHPVVTSETSGAGNLSDAN